MGKLIVKWASTLFRDLPKIAVSDKCLRSLCPQHPTLLPGYGHGAVHAALVQPGCCLSSPALNTRVVYLRDRFLFKPFPVYFSASFVDLHKENACAASRALFYQK